MRKILFIVAVLFSHGCIAQERQEVLHENAEQILYKSLNALGGKDAWAGLGNWSFSGTGEAFSSPAQFNISGTSSFKQRVVVATKIYQLERSFDDVQGWERMSWEGAFPKAAPYVRELAPSVTSRFLRRGWLPPVYRYVQEQIPVSVTGMNGEEEQEEYILRFELPDGSAEDLYIAKGTYLPVRRTFLAEYEDGIHEVSVEYGDYRAVGKLMLPYMIESYPLQVGSFPTRVEVKDYVIDSRQDGQQFQYPMAEMKDAPYKISISTVPLNIYKEDDWLLSGPDWDTSSAWATTIAPTETWTFDLLFDEQYGRWMEPAEVSIDFFAGDRLVRSMIMSEAELRASRRLNVARYSGIGAVSVFRHHWTMARGLDVDRMIYTFKARSPEGRVVEASRQIPVSRYEQKTSMIFPVRASFMIFSAHDYDDINHKDERSQWGAYDIVVLGKQLEVLKGTGRKAKDHVAYGHEVIAPADGTVVYARNDILDGPISKELMSRLPDQMNIGPGNHIIIDHGNSEYSFFCHLKHGSVHVEVGDHVRQGQVIANLGDTMSKDYPHLHFQLMSGPVSLRADGIPSRFENVELAYPTPGLGLKIAVPKRGYYFIAR